MLQRNKYVFLQDLKSKLQFLNYSKHTIKIYSHYVELFLDSLDCEPSKMNSRHFENYIRNYNFSSVSQQNQIISSLKFFYEKVLKKKYKKIDFARPRKEKRLPRIIDFETAKKNILAINNLKHKAILSLAISTGLRVSEILNLKLGDIDSNRMLIFVSNGKGRKDRFVPLSDNLLLILRDYYSEYKPKTYLFTGQKSEQYSATSCNKIVKRYLGNDKSMHVLRHTFLTFLAEKDVNISKIQKIAGHNNPKTTNIYLHLAVDNFKQIPNIL